MQQEELLYTIALTQVPGIGCVRARNLLKAVGNATDVFRHRNELPQLMNGITPRIVELLNCPQAIERAKQEYEFVQKHQIQCLAMDDERYPARLRDCEDAPVLLYYMGTADLNTAYVVNMVGTRHATAYGRELCSSFLQDLKRLCPDVLVVSGLAYGIDVQAHSAALANGFSTIGVLAHGLDRIYPPEHRRIANEMLNQGGLLTEFPSKTEPDRYNFVSRNRIVAGICDATIVVESAAKGGSLITAELAESYHRDCFAFPGRVNDEYSKGCHQLIRSNRAALIQSAEDFVASMGWNNKQSGTKPNVQLRIFPELTPDEQIVVDVLKNVSDMQHNTLVVNTNLPIHKLNSTLFELEMKGVVRALAGGMYKLM